MDFQQPPTTAPSTAGRNQRAQNPAGYIAELESVLCTLWLHTGWYEQKHMTTAEKELFADVIDAHHAELNIEDNDPLGFTAFDRWWRPTFPAPTEQ